MPQVNRTSSTTSRPRRVWFLRNLRRFSGGHLKVFHYYRHVETIAGFEPRIWFTPETTWDASNPWFALRDRAEPRWAPAAGDLIFLAGMDWEYALRGGALDNGLPVINLIQHVRHALPDQDVHRFLAQPAVRICVSGEVTEALHTSGAVNGPVLTIPNGTDVEPRDEPTWPNWDPTSPLLLLATKHGAFATRLRDALADAGVALTYHDRFLPRPQFLERLARHGLTVCCPDPTEGFYLPALEAMAQGSLVVCPDCVGNRGFCRDGFNALRPAYDLPSVLDAVHRARDLAPSAVRSLRRSARQTAVDHGLAAERRRFAQVLREIDALWRSAGA